jgi:small subunit ribosomal protein S5
MELGGVSDVLTKVIGRTSNPINVAYATMKALKGLRTPAEVMRLRGKEAPQAQEA